MSTSGALRRLVAAVLGLALLVLIASASCAGSGSKAVEDPPAARLVVDTRTPGVAVADSLFGTNLIWPGGAQGIFDAKEKRARREFVEAARAIGVRCLRHPGGTLSHLYHFANAIGPLEERLPIMNAFTRREEVAAFGTDEFLAFCADVGALPLVVVAYADGSKEEAAAWVAYLNGRVGDRRAIGIDARGRDWGTVSDWAERRARHGHPAPHGVRLFEVGNETDLKRFGRTVAEYSTTFRAFAGAMKAVDGSIRVGAVGHLEALGEGATDAALRSAASGSAGAPPPQPWNERLFREAGEAIDFLTLHFYGPEEEPDDERLLEKPRGVRVEIDSIRALARRCGLSRSPEIALTEYNAGFHAKEGGFSSANSSPRAALFDAATWLEMVSADLSIAVLHTLTVAPVAEPELQGWTHFGILRRDGAEVKPTVVGATFGLLSSALAGGKRLGIRAPEGLVAAATLHDDGKLGVAVLSRSSRAPLRLSLDLGGFRGRLQRHARLDSSGVSDVAPVAGSSEATTLEIAPFTLHVLEYAP